MKNKTKFLYLLIISLNSFKSFSQSKFDTIYYKKFKPYINFGVQNDIHNILVNGLKLNTSFSNFIIGEGVYAHISKEIEIKAGVNIALGASYSLIFENGNYQFNQTRDFYNKNLVYNYGYIGFQTPITFFYKPTNQPFNYQLAVLYDYNIVNQIFNPLVKFNSSRLAIGVGFGKKIKLNKAVYSNIDFNYYWGTSVLNSSNSNLIRVDKVNADFFSLNFSIESNYYLKRKQSKRRFRLSNLLGNKISK